MAEKGLLSGRRTPNGFDRKLGAVLRTLRKKKERSMDSVGFDVGISYQQYAKLENGESRCTVSRLIDICRVLEAPVERVLGLL